MLVSEAIAYCKQLAGNVVTDEDMVRWLSELDGRLALEFYRADAWAPYDPEDDMGAELLVPFPWDGFYPHHLEAMCYYAHGEYDRYEKAQILSESLLSEFRAFMQRTQSAICGCGFPTEKAGGTYVTVIPEQAESVWFWISAYSLAIKHGYKGTEEEWLESLHGKDGKDGISGKETYVHHQYSASDEWVINHNMDAYPSVTVVDSGNTQVIGNVKYIDEDNVVLTFSAPFSGSAYLN